MSLTGASTRPDRNEARADRRAGRSRRGAGGTRSAGGIARMGRATRRRDRERQARVRDSLRGARNALRRLGESRATYRDLALRVEAALLRTVPRRDLGGLEGRLAHALRAAGFEMPEASDG